MEAKQKEALTRAGINVNSAINRFMGREDMFEKYLMMFLYDKNYLGLCLAIENRDVEKAFAYAHTMKGIITNLSIDSLTEVIIPIVEELRAKSLLNVGPLLEKYSVRYEELKKVVLENFS